MQIVIKLPEKIYKHILSMQFYIPGSRSGKSILEEILKAIRTGTPLPKRHGRLIDADELLKQSYRIDDSATLSTRDVVNVEEIDGVSTIIEADMRDKENEE